MTPKTYRKYELITQITGGGDRIKTIAELMAIDFNTAFEMWEFAIDKTGDGGLVGSGLDLFMRASESKTKTMFCDSAPLQKLIYSSPSAVNENIVNFLTSFIINNKLEIADECLNKMRANTNIDFSDAMKTVVDRVFKISCEKNGVRVPVLNKKQKTLLLNYIEKIKGQNKALLLQRMKEIT